MKFLFEITVIIYIIIYIYILSQMYIMKNRINFKRVKSNFLSSILLLLIIYIFKIQIPYFILILYIIAVLICSYFGYFLDFFNRFKHFDRYLHGYGTFSFSLLLYFFLINFVQSGGSRTYQAFFVLFLGMSIGAIFEIIEFIGDAKQKEPTTYRSTRQKSLRDTDFDLISDLFGSVLSSLFAYFFYL